MRVEEYRGSGKIPCCFLSSCSTILTPDLTTSLEEIARSPGNIWTSQGKGPEAHQELVVVSRQKGLTRRLRPGQTLPEKLNQFPWSHLENGHWGAGLIHRTLN